MANTNEMIMQSDISLLYPDEDSLRRNAMGEDLAGLSHETEEQLELSCLMDLKSCDFGSFYTAEPEVIAYRQETFADMIANPSLIGILHKMIPLLNDITELRRMGSDSAASTEAYLYSITEVELYTSLLELLQTQLLPLAPGFRSRAFRRFAERINTLTGSDYYRNLNDELKALTSRVREIKSITIGVNLDAQLRADRAGVLSINNDYFKSGDLLDKMLRLDFKNDDMTCIAPLVSFRKGQSDNQQAALSNAFNGAINDVFKASVRGWKKVIRMYVLENTDFLLRMMPEIEFVTKGTELLLKLESIGCPLCYPVIKPMGDKVFRTKGLCNPIVTLKLNAPVVPNDFCFDDEGMIYVLTGPNRGGKSVITCAVGIAFVMAQLGLPVCADECVISPSDTVFTHFPTGSEDTIDKGRLGEECSRLGAIFEQVTEDSLVLLDESLSSTGSYEGAYIASEVLQGFSLVGCRSIFCTHLHDLAASVDAINETCLPKGGVRVDNLVAAIEEGSRSFKIRRMKPDGKSYARDIAEKYGLSIDKILDKIQQQ